MRSLPTASSCCRRATTTVDLDSAIVFNAEELEAPDPIRIRPDDIVGIRIAS
jgi:hypothetical protein